MTRPVRTVAVLALTAMALTACSGNSSSDSKSSSGSGSGISQTSSSATSSATDASKMPMPFKFANITAANGLDACRKLLGDDPSTVIVAPDYTPGTMSNDQTKTAHEWGGFSSAQGGFTAGTPSVLQCVISGKTNAVRNNFNDATITVEVSNMGPDANAIKVNNQHLGSADAGYISIMGQKFGSNYITINDVATSNAGIVYKRDNAANGAEANYAADKAVFDKLKARDNDLANKIAAKIQS